MYLLLRIFLYSYINEKEIQCLRPLEHKLYDVNYDVRHTPTVRLKGRFRCFQFTPLTVITYVCHTQTHQSL